MLPGNGTRMYSMNWTIQCALGMGTSALGMCQCALGMGLTNMLWEWDYANVPWEWD